MGHARSDIAGEEPSRAVALPVGPGRPVSCGSIHQGCIVMRCWICLLITLGLIPGSLSTADEQPADLAMVPADSVFFAHVRLQDLYMGEQFKLFLDVISKADPKALAAYDRMFFPAPSSLDRVTIIWPAAEMGKPVMMMTTSKAIERDAFV